MNVYEEEFIDYIDERAKVDSMLLMEREKAITYTEQVNVSEKIRVATIKRLISSTHTWESCKEWSQGKFAMQFFVCKVCGIQCSIFENIRYLSIIKKVDDELPTYTAHNEFLMDTCDDVLSLQNDKHTSRCDVCAIFHTGATDKCIFLNSVKEPNAF